MAALNNEVTRSQCSQILEYLQAGKAITTPKARALCRCERLAARISDLRKKGYGIETKIIYTKLGRVKYASYSLIKT